MSRFENTEQFETANPYAARNPSTLKVVLLLVALLAYAAGFIILYPVVASSVANSVSTGNDPALLQFVGP